MVKFDTTTCQNLEKEQVTAAKIFIGYPIFHLFMSLMFVSISAAV